MKTVRITISFAGVVKTIYHQIEDTPEAMIRCRNQFEVNPVVLRLEVADEPDHEALWKGHFR